MVQVTQIPPKKLSYVAQIGYDPQMCEQEKSAWIPIFSDWFQASFISGNKSDMNQICAFVSAKKWRRQIMLTEIQCCQGHGFSVALGLFYTFAMGCFSSIG